MSNNANRLKPFTVTRRPIVECPVPRCSGVLWRVPLSRLEEGLHHEGFRCDKCEHAVKYVPPAFYANRRAA